MFHSLNITAGYFNLRKHVSFTKHYSWVPHHAAWSTSWWDVWETHSRQCKVVSDSLHGSVAVCTDMFMFTLYMFTGQLYGLEKFWAFLKYSRCKVTIDKRLKQLLSKYKRLEDFRVEVRIRGLLQLSQRWSQCLL